jgi:putative endonuclease
MYYFYVLQSLEDKEKFYFGCTSNLRERLKSHNTGQNTATKSNQWRVVYYEAFLTLSGARQREYRIKHHGSAKRNLMNRIKPTLE